MAFGWTVANKAHERWILRIQLPHPSHIPNVSTKAEAKPALRPQEGKKQAVHQPLPDLLSAFFPLLLSFPFGFVLQSYLSTVAERWSLQTVEGFQIIKASRYFMYECTWSSVQHRYIMSSFSINVGSVGGQHWKRVKFPFKKQPETVNCVSQDARWNREEN